MISVTFPGKIGDCLYTLPTLRELYKLNNEKVDFYTSQYCSSLRKLFECQSCINKFTVLDNYKISNMDCGVQPWKMEVPVVDVIHLGFRENPDRPLHKYIGNLIGLKLDDNIFYEIPYSENTEGEYYILAPGGKKEFVQLFRRVVENFNHKVIVVGKLNEYFGYGVNKTGLDFLETTQLISHARGFIGTTSAHLVLANGFKISKVVLCNNMTGDKNHLIHSNLHFYLDNPNVEEILKRLECSIL